MGTDGRESKLRLGMIGGGEGAFIGAVHRIAARIDDQYEFVAGALSATPEKSVASGRALDLDPARAYPDFATMLREEAPRRDGVEVVAIVTLNHMHAPAARACLEAGRHVICDKPLAARIDEAIALCDLVRKCGLIFAVTYNYTGYPMVRQAREMVRAGTLGRIRVIQVEYAQDWLAEPLEQTGHKQAAWRNDPALTGKGGAIGNIGTHAFNLAELITGLELTEIAADLQTFVPGRRVDNNAHVLLRFSGGARGMLWASQVAPGNDNALRISVYGEKGSIAWQQENPNQLRFAPLNEAPRLIARGTAAANAAAARVTRIPGGHPEGYLEAFATLYREIASAIRAHRAGSKPAAEVTYPTVHDGLRGLAFIEAAVASSAAGARWTPVTTYAGG